MHVTRSASEALAPEWYSPPTGCGEQTPIRVSHVITGSDSAKAEVKGRTVHVNECHGRGGQFAVRDCERTGGAVCYTGRVTEDMVRAAMPLCCIGGPAHPDRVGAAKAWRCTCLLAGLRLEMMW